MWGTIPRAIFIGIVVLGLSSGAWAKDSVCISNVKEKVEQITTQAHDLGIWLGDCIM